MAQKLKWSLDKVMEGVSEEDWDRREAEIAARRAEAEREEREKRIKNGIDTLARCGVGSRHVREVYFGNHRPSLAMTAAREFGDDGIWALSGSVGCGKTYAAVWWLCHEGESLQLLEDIRYSKQAMVSAVKFARLSRYERDADGLTKFDLYAEPHRLVLDDLGVEFSDSKGSFLSDLDELLDLRWSNEKPTVITTNLLAKDFKERYGHRIADRIRDEGGWCNVAADSMRSKK